MSNGTQQIAKERLKQENNGRNGKSDARINPNGELIWAALFILDHDNDEKPPNWGDWIDMAAQRSYKERVRIAGALMAAELDRIDYEEHIQPPKNEK